MPQMRSLRSLFSAGSDGARPKCPVAPSNRTTACTVRRTSPFTQNPHPHRPTSRIVSYSITRSIRATQIPIVRDQPPSSHFARFPPLEVFRRRPPMPRGSVRQRPASEPSHEPTWLSQPTPSPNRHPAAGRAGLPRISSSFAAVPRKRAPGRSTRRVWPGAPTSAARRVKGQMTRPRVKDSPSPPPLLTSLRAWLTRDSRYRSSMSDKDPTATGIAGEQPPVPVRTTVDFSDPNGHAILSVDLPVIQGHRHRSTKSCVAVTRLFSSPRVT
jgi:hypothetical protein